MAAANSWFLAFNAETALCWSFCAELIAQAHSRLEAEFPAENGTSNEIQVAVSRYTHECFFAVKLLQNVVLVAEQWQQVVEGKYMSDMKVLLPWCVKCESHNIHM